VKIQMALAWTSSDIAERTLRTCRPSLPTPLFGCANFHPGNIPGTCHFGRLAANCLQPYPSDVLFVRSTFGWTTLNSRCPRCDEEGEDGSGFEGRHRHGVVVSCFFQTFNLDFTPRSPTYTHYHYFVLLFILYDQATRSLHHGPVVPVRVIGRARTTAFAQLRR